MTRRLAWAVLGLASLAIPARAADPTLPIAQQVPLLLKVLTYEKSLMQSGPTTLRLGILLDPQDEESRRQFAEFEREFRPYADKTVRGHAVELVPVEIGSASRQTIPPAATGVQLLYVSCTDPQEIARVRQWTRSRKILSVTPSEAAVNAGLTLGLVVRNGRTGVAINRTASREEGKEWSEEFLRLCRITE